MPIRATLAQHRPLPLHKALQSFLHAFAADLGERPDACLAGIFIRIVQ